MATPEAQVESGTRGRILEELAVSPKTARDLSKSLGIQESAARGHLERLEARGLVVPTFRREGVGRPRKRYLLTTQGRDLFPRRYEMLLDSVMDELIAREGESYVSGLFANAARNLAHQIARGVPSDASRHERATALAASLNQLGFRCTIEENADGTLKIVRTNCVFRHSALAHAQLLCDVFDKNLTEGLIGQEGLDLKDSIPRGGTCCTHLIRLA